ncbi:MAG: prepilin-type N-terminal cleavage/methylation domain-containing protein [Lachnospiraceae bacterium]|nr:prepilin-type N-terminal cleavage/methylation domain-containing protein [Lachnospiraceae bacterium]
MAKVHKNTGATIVEMLVCFVLLGILMVAAGQFLASSMRTYTTAKRGIAGREAADVVADHIEGLLESACIKKSMKPFTVSNKELTFWDKQRRKATICCDENGYLDVIYANGKNEPSHWRFDKGVYKGYTISEMRFVLSAPAEIEVGDEEEYLDSGVYEKNSLKLELTLESPQNGKYETVRYIRFGNVK